MAEVNVHREIRVTEGTYKQINWLDHWGPIRFINCREGDHVRIAELQRKLLIMIRGELAEFNATNNTNYFVIDYHFETRGPDPNDPVNIPVRYDAYAFLFPTVTVKDEALAPNGNGNGGGTKVEPPVGGHLYPPPPPPPDEIR